MRSYLFLLSSPDNQDTAAVEVRDESKDNEEAVKVGCFMVCTAAAEIFS